MRSHEIVIVGGGYAKPRVQYPVTSSHTSVRLHECQQYQQSVGAIAGSYRNNYEASSRYQPCS